jgi:hypothetical protein
LYLLSIIFHFISLRGRRADEEEQKFAFVSRFCVFNGMKVVQSFYLVNKRPEICVLGLFVSSQIDLSLKGFVTELAGEGLETWG